jgi:hypothetical protein
LNVGWILFERLTFGTLNKPAAGWVTAADHSIPDSLLLEEKIRNIIPPFPAGDQSFCSWSPYVRGRYSIIKRAT